MGHVFVVRGRLESIHCDAVIIPTDSKFSVRRIWDKAREGTHRPRQINGFVAADGTADGRRVWFVDITSKGESSLTALQHNLGKALAEIGSTLNEAAHLPTDRERPLVAVPMVGVGGGGLDKSAGDVVSGLVKTLMAAATGIDIALVAFRESDYAAAQWARRHSHDCAQLQHSDEARRLAKVARQQGLSLLVGAGVSMAAGLPSWSGLLKRCLPEGDGLANDPAFDRLAALDQAEYIRRRLGESSALTKKIASVVGEVRRPGLGHLLLASLDCREAVTTNYDRLYEAAVGAQHGKDWLRVIPYQHAEARKPWLAKLHGDVGHVEDIVIARRDFVSFDAKSGPAGALFQSMLMTTHLLAVGASFADDNILRLTHEVSTFLGGQREKTESDSQTDQPRTLGTVLTLGNDELRSTIWEPELHWVGITGRTDGTTKPADPESEIKARARQLEIFLDHLALHACSSSSYLLDERYASLLGDDADLAKELRNVAGQLPAGPPRAGEHTTKSGTGDKWKPLRDAFRDHGFRPGGHR